MANNRNRFFKRQYDIIRGISQSILIDIILLYDSLRNIEVLIIYPSVEIYAIKIIISYVDENESRTERSVLTVILKKKFILSEALLSFFY